MTHILIHPTLVQTGVILHLHVRIGGVGGGGDATGTRRLMVPCETLGHARGFKFKLDQALLAWQSAAAHAPLPSHQQPQQQRA